MRLPRRWPAPSAGEGRALAGVVVAAALLSAALVALVAGLALPWGRDATDADGPGAAVPDRPASRVGRAACAACHEEALRRWTGSHHDLAMQPATEETVLGDFDGAVLRVGGVAWRFLRRDGRFLVRTAGAGADAVEVEVAYTFGVAPLQQYLVPFPGGRFQALSVAWDSRPRGDGGQRWFALRPDAEATPAHPLHWTRLSQTWNTSCAGCHSTGLRRGFDVASATYSTTWAEIDVSCEACHGPGSEHVEHARAGAATPPRTPADGWGIVAHGAGPSREWVFAPGETTASPVAPEPARREVEGCARCHARGSVLEEGPPGRPLLDTRVPSLLREDLYHADGQMLDEVYVYGSFVQSRMYAAGVRCSDCHDPHGLGLRAQGNALCAGCHRADAYDDRAHHFHEPGSPGARCVECHMPATTYMEVDPRRDHSLRIPRPDLTEALGVPDACGGCHADRSATWAARAVEEHHGPRGGPEPHFARALHAGRRGDPRAVPGLVRVAGDPGRAAIVRGTALSLLAGYPATAAVPALERAVDDPEPLVRLGALRGMEGRPAASLVPLAAPRLADSLLAVRVEAARLLAGAPPATLSPGQATALEGALAEYEAVRRANADHPASWVELGDLQARRGRVAEAEDAYRTALRIDSTFVAAWVNLADLQRALGRTTEEDEVLTRGLDAVPSAPELQHAMGLRAVRRGDRAAALPWLERAARSAPDVPRFAYVHGAALAAADATEEALRVLREALARHPFDRDLLTALTTYSRELGEREAALGYAERLAEVAPDDPSVASLVEALRRAGR